MASAAARPLFLTLALVGYAAWVLAVGAHHEPWFDEAQAWLLARDTPGLWALLMGKVRYEGTPGLWHALVWGAIRLGLPYAQFHLLAAACAIAGAGVVLFCAPFPPVLRLGVLFSYVFAYQFSVVARGYSLDLVLIPLAAAFFAARAARPLRYALVVGLIANVNAHGFLAAAMLGLEWLWQIRRAGQTPLAIRLPAVLLMGGSGLFALACAWQPADNGALHGAIANPLAAALGFLCNAFIDRLSFWSSSPQGPIEIFLAALISVLIQRPVVRLVMAGRHRLVTLAVVGAPIAFSGLVYVARWHAGVLFLLWLFVLWINWENRAPDPVRRQVALVLGGVCLFQGAQALHSGLLDIATPYASGRAAAMALVDWRASHAGGRIDAFGFKAFEVQPWLPGNVFANYHHGAPYPAYLIWARGEPWSAAITPESWRRELAGGADLVLASPTSLQGEQLALGPIACRMGYGVAQSFPAMMIWRGARIEDETLFLYRRGASCRHNP